MKTTRNHAKNSENVSNKLLTQCTSVFPKSNSSAEQFSSRCATIKQVMNDERGIGTLEIVIIIAVLLAVALLFRESLMAFASNLISKVFDDGILAGF